MLKIRHVLLIVLLGMPLYSVASTSIQMSMGINVPVYPELVVVPGYPVYYAPREEANLFFYDGMYWVYQDDNWYASSWYNGPWEYVYPEDMPVFVLRIPVRYYRRPPVYFRGWISDAPPRWGDHWGRGWEQRRSGWDRWNHSVVPAPAPLPVYQRQYSGDRYPRQVEQQRQLINRNYRYQPRDPVARQHFQGRAVQGAPAQRGANQPDTQRFTPPQHEGSAAQSPPRGNKGILKSIPAAPQQGRQNILNQAQQPRPTPDQRREPMTRPQGQEDKQPGKKATRKQKPGQEQEQGQEQKQKREQGRDRNE